MSCIRERTIERNISYPKPPALDMKWVNCYINALEWAKIPKSSALDDLVTPLILLKFFCVSLQIIVS